MSGLHLSVHVSEHASSGQHLRGSAAVDSRQEISSIDQLARAEATGWWRQNGKGSLHQGNVQMLVVRTRVSTLRPEPPLLHFASLAERSAR